LATGFASMHFIESLSQLFREHHRRVLTAAYRITGNMADAEDVAQSVFLRLAGNDQSVENAGSYLYRAAINGALDLLRRRKTAGSEPLERAADVPSAGWGSSPEAEASGRQLGSLLRLAISELPERAAEMFTLRYLEEMDNSEVAALISSLEEARLLTGE